MFFIPERHTDRAPAGVDVRLWIPPGLGRTQRTSIHRRGTSNKPDNITHHNSRKNPGRICTWCFWLSAALAGRVSLQTYNKQRKTQRRNDPKHMSIIVQTCAPSFVLFIAAFARQCFKQRPKLLTYGKTAKTDQTFNEKQINKICGSMGLECGSVGLTCGSVAAPKTRLLECGVVAAHPTNCSKAIDTHT